MKNVAFLVALVVVFFSPISILAKDDDSNSSPTSSPSTKIIELNKERQEKIKEAVKEKQEDYRESKLIRVASREAFIKEREEARDEFREKLDEAKKLWEQKKEELKEKLQSIKDEKKKEVTQNISERIEERNSKWVSHWNDVVKRLSEVLAKMEVRGGELKNKGVNTGSFETKLAAAKSAISLAQTKINTQAGKTYTFSITSEQHLGEAVKNSLSGFHADVKAVIESINAARTAVKEAFTALKALVKDSPSASPSPTSSPTPTP